MRVVHAVAIVAVAGAFAHCTKTRDVIERPGLTVRVVDASGAPVANATVMVSHWSLPHRKLHRSETFVADASGSVTTTREVGQETVMPLCMHGVPQHGYTVCAASPSGGVAVTNWRRDESTAIELRLDPARKGDCADDLVQRGLGDHVPTAAGDARD